MFFERYYRPEALKFIFKILGRYRGYIVSLGFAGAIGGILAGVGAGIIIPLFSLVLGEVPEGSSAAVNFIVRFFDKVPYGKDPKVLSAVLVLIFLVRATLLYGVGYFKTKIRQKYMEDVMGDLYSTMMRVAWPFWFKQKFGHMQNALLRDIYAGSSVVESFSQIIITLTSTLIFIAFAFMFSPWVSLLLISAGVVIYFIYTPLVRKVRTLGAEFGAREREVNHLIAEQFLGIKSIKSAAVEAGALKKGREQIHGWLELFFLRTVLRSLNSVLVEPIGVILVAFAFVFSYGRPDFSLQVFAATVFLIQRASTYLQQGVAALEGFFDVLPRAEYALRMREALLEETEAGAGGRAQFRLLNQIEFKDVRFGYGKGGEVLSGITFSLKKGEIVGLIGQSGAGKTTIIDLLMRLLRPTEGNVLLDGVKSENFDIADWRRRVGYVPQDIFLEHDTIENNIRFYDDGLTQEEIREAAKKANIYDFVMSLEKGFETVVGDRGIALSAGQRQRIVLARALARNPSVLLLDEATSALDNESELLIQKSIESLRGRVSVFIVAHRLSTVLNADRVLVLDRGKIVEEGAPRKLLEDPASYFSKMYHLNERERER